MIDAFAGIDVGTTNIKCLLFDEDGRTLAEAAVATGWRADEGQCEQHAGEFVERATEVLGTAVAQTRDAQVRALGVTGMAEAGVLLDADRSPLAPVVGWSDYRADADVDGLWAAIDRASFEIATGLPATGRATAAKLYWESLHRPQSRPAQEWVGVPEWVAHRLGGRVVSERSLASRTGLYDVLADRWITGHVAATGLPELRLPELVDAGESIGTLDSSDPHLRGAAIVVGGHDHVCASVGVGFDSAGDVFDSMGTGEAVIAAVDASSMDAADIGAAVGSGLTVGRHIHAGQLSVMAGLGTGLLLARALRLIGVDPTSPDVAAVRSALDEEALAVPRSGMLLHADPDGEWNLTGIDADAGPAEVWRAALETAARRLGDALERIEAVVGPRRRFAAAGGWLRSEVVRATKQAAVGDIVWSTLEEPGALGAARLAARAVGVDLSAGLDDLQRGA